MHRDLLAFTYLPIITQVFMIQLRIEAKNTGAKQARAHPQQEINPNINFLLIVGTASWICQYLFSQEHDHQKYVN